MKSFNIPKIFNHQRWITPVLKQSFVTIGVSLNSMAMGIILGFTVALTQQLTIADSDITIDEDQASWIASLPGLFAFAGTIVAITIMEKYGRRTSNLISITILVISWITIIFATNLALLYTARALQGINLGMSIVLGSVSIGEYTSPKYRGAFLITISISIALGVLLAHIIALSIPWKTGAIICSVIALIDLIIVYFSPESPSWLASKGKYEECKKAFRWLRGDKEDVELDKIISVCNSSRNLNVSELYTSGFAKVKSNFKNFSIVVRKKEFYQPLIIVTHLYTLQVWCGINILVGFPNDYINKTSGPDIDVFPISASFDIQRVVSSLLAAYLVKKFRRRLMLLVTISMNIISLIIIAVYSFVKVNYAIPLDHPIIGVLLSHVMMISISLGALSLPFTIVGEIMPLAHKSLIGGIGTLIYSTHIFIVFKSMSYCLTHFGVHGTMCINAAIITYCVAVVLFILPETKDKTLQNIEEEFKDKSLRENVKLDRVFTISSEL